MVVSLRPGSAGFDSAVASIRAAKLRSELVVDELRPPDNLAPFAFALAADVRPAGLRGGPASPPLGNGRFILLHDPAEPEPWRGAYRIVCLAQAPLETDIGGDPLLPDVAWSWLVDALAVHDADYRYPSGTATVINAKGYGELASQGEGSQIELRASWTPQSTDIGHHLESWGALLCMLAGLPPLDSAEVPVLRPRIAPDDRR